MKECPKCGVCYEDRVEYCSVDSSPVKKVFLGSPVLDNKYRLERTLGHGGMGAVYRACHLNLQKTFALKVIHPRKREDEGFFARFQLEAKALGQLDHPNIVGVTDFGVDLRNESIPYLVMEYLEGLSLDKYLRKLGRALSYDEAMPILQGIAEGLDYVHRKGLLHRDLKPANVFLVGGNPGEVRIVDFGIAKFLQDSVATVADHSERAARLGEPENFSTGDTSSTAELPEEGPAGLTAPGVFLGTVDYMAPENIEGGDTTRTADIYSFGVLIYEVLVGHLPFSGNVQQILTKHQLMMPQAPSKVNPSISMELEEAILKPLQKDPLLRPANANQVVGFLAEAAFRARMKEWKDRELSRRLGYSVGLALLCVVFAWLFLRWGPMNDIENKLLDARFHFAASTAPYDKVLILAIDDATLSADPTPLADKADEMGRILQQVFQAGARGIAVDILLPEKWSHSVPLSDLVLSHTNDLVFAAWTAPGGSVLGPESLRGLTTVALGENRVRQLFGFVNVQEDPDGVIRRFNPVFRTAAGELFPSFGEQTKRIILGSASNADRSQEAVWIDYSAGWPAWRKISWKDTSNLLEQDPAVFKGRFVIVGAEFSGSGDESYAVPHPAGLPGQVSGSVLQLLMVNTLLTGQPVRSVSILLFLPVIFLAAAIVSFLFLYSHKPLTAGLICGVIGLAYVLISFGVFSWRKSILPIGSFIGVLLLCVALAGLARRKLAGRPQPWMKGGPL